MPSFGGQNFQGISIIWRSWQRQFSTQRYMVLIVGLQADQILRLRCKLLLSEPPATHFDRIPRPSHVHHWGAQSEPHGSEPTDGGGLLTRALRGCPCIRLYGLRLWSSPLAEQSIGARVTVLSIDVCPSGLGSVGEPIRRSLGIVPRSGLQLL